MRSLALTQPRPVRVVFALQDRYDTRQLADRLEQNSVQAEVSDQDKAFIESRDMFWLSTIDEQGRPTVSYRGD